jgi:hypothetical protein
MIKWIIILVIGLIILGYLGIDIRNVINSSTSQSNLGYVKEVVLHVWNTYLAKPAKYLWNEIFLKLVWSTAIDNLTKIKNGEPTNAQTSSPPLPTVPNIN